MLKIIGVLRAQNAINALLSPPPCTLQIACRKDACSQVTETAPIGISLIRKCGEINYLLSTTGVCQPPDHVCRSRTLAAGTRRAWTCAVGSSRRVLKSDFMTKRLHKRHAWPSRTSAEAGRRLWRLAQTVESQASDAMRQRDRLGEFGMNDVGVFLPFVLLYPHLRTCQISTNGHGDAKRNLPF
jgi:hypothetical protein